jgi:hypothetical protein
MPHFSMDCRVKPGNDDKRLVTTGLDPVVHAAATI